MAMKRSSGVFVVLVLVALMATSAPKAQAQAQLSGLLGAIVGLLQGIVGGPLGLVSALLSGLNQPLAILQITGTVNCSVNATAGTSTQVAVPGAASQLRCGGLSVGPTVITNSTGMLSLNVPVTGTSLQTLGGNCSVVAIINSTTSNCTAKMLVSDVKVTGINGTTTAGVPIIGAIASNFVPLV